MLGLVMAWLPMRVVLAGLTVLAINYAVPTLINAIFVERTLSWVTQFVTNLISFFGASLLLRARVRSIGTALLVGFTLIYAAGVHIALRDFGVISEPRTAAQMYAVNLGPYFIGGLLGIFVGAAVVKSRSGEVIDAK